MTAVRVRVHGYPKDEAIEVEVVGKRIWLTYIGTQGGRRATMGLSGDEGRKLATLLRQAADAIKETP